MRKVILVFCALCTTAFCAGEPDVDALRWGKPEGGLQLALQSAETARLWGAVPLQLHLRSLHEAPLPLDLSKATGYLVVVQGKQAWITQPLVLAKVWPDLKSLLPAQASYISPALDFYATQLFIYHPAMEERDGYPLLSENASALQPKDILKLGNIIVALTLYVPRAERTPLRIRSEGCSIALEAPKFTGLSPEQQQDYIQTYLTGFSKDAVAAKRSYDAVAKAGVGILPALKTILDGGTCSEHGKMWLMTAFCDIGGADAAGILVHGLKDANGGVRHVIAFHGPKVASSELDRAILTQALTSDAETTAWAIRGYSTFRKTVPTGLIDYAQAHQDERLRATAIDAIFLARPADTRERLIKLIADPHPQVSAGAARAVGKLALKDESVTRALAKRLSGNADDATMVADISAALSALTGKNQLCPADADEATRQAAISFWQNQFAD